MQEDNISHTDTLFGSAESEAAVADAFEAASRVDALMFADGGILATLVHVFNKKHVMSSRSKKGSRSHTLALQLVG